MRKLNSGHSNLVSIILMVQLLIFWSSCVENRVEPKFDKTPTGRQQQVIHELRETLKQSEHGWELSYMTLGAEYNFVFKFLKDSIAETYADFSPADTLAKTSEYNIRWGSTVKLSFVTNSPLHRLSDSDISPSKNKAQQAKGLQGSFEFLYYQKAANGQDLIFRNERTQAPVIFKKATAHDLDTLKAHAKNLARFKSNLQGGLFEPSINYTLNQKLTRSSITLSNDNRTITLRGITTSYDAQGKPATQWASPYTTVLKPHYSGIAIKSLTVGYKGLQDLNMVYDLSEKKYKAELANGAVLEIITNDKPLMSYDGHKALLDKTDRYKEKFIELNKNLLSLVSPAAKPRIDAYFASGLDFFSLYFKFNGGFTGFYQVWISIEGKGQYLSYATHQDRLVITTTRALSNLSTPERQKAYDDLINLLTDTKGFYVKKAGKATQYKNDVYIFISVKNPSIKIPFFQVFKR